MASPAVQVLVADPFLARAITSTLSCELGEDAVVTIDESSEALRDTLVVTTSTSCSPGTAARIVARGSTLLVLAPLLTGYLVQRYTGTGAIISLMESRNLVQQVREFLPRKVTEAAAVPSGLPQ